MVPNGWKESSLGSIAKWYSGSTPSKANPEFWGGDIPWISATSMRGIYYFSSVLTITEKAISAGAKIAPINSILILVRGSMLWNKIPVGITTRDVSFNQDVKCLVPFSNKAVSEFILYWFLANEYKLMNMVTGTGIGAGKLDTTELKSLNISLPTLSEQKKIATILSTWDKAITTTEQLLTNSQKQKKALMQQLLTGKKRLLDKSGVRFSGEWKFQSISQISKRIQRKSDGGDHPILTISSLSGFVRQDERYSRYMAGESVKNYILLENGEFAYNKGNSKTYEFGCIFDLDSYESGLVPHVYVCFRLNQGLSHRYFKYLYEADYLKPQLGALVNTGVRNNGLLNIKPSEFMATKVPVPCIEEQERIADVLHASSSTIHKLQQKLDYLKQEKKALMQQLLTGKRRVFVN